MKIPKGLENKFFLFDKLRINQIFDNLIINANKFTQNGIISFGIEEIKDLGAFCRFTFFVKDTGVGMTQKQADKIFDDFVQVSEEQKQKGFGLGLAIVQQYVKVYSGKIKAFSEKTKGTIIRFEMTFEKGTQRNQMIENYKLDVKDLKILLVDDDPISLLLLKAGFSKQNNQADSAQNFTEAVELITKNKYDIIITDFNLNDNKTAFQLKEQTSKDLKTKWILLSGDSINPTIYTSNGFEIAIQKPANLNTILKEIHLLQKGDKTTR